MISISKKIIYLYIISYLSFLMGCYNKEPLVEKDKFQCMGTKVEVILVAPEKEYNITDKIFNEIRKECRICQNKFSIFNPDSIVNKINSSKKYFVDDETMTLLVKAKYIANISNGGFDFTITPLMKLWGFYSENKINSIPSPAEIEKLKPYIGCEKIKLVNKKGKNLIIKKNKNVAIDLSGIAKGFIVDKIVQLLKSYNVKKAIVNAGGDMYCLGKALDDTPWKIGIQHPRLKSAIIGKVDLSDKAIVTSGDYENYFLVGNKRYSHTINPYNGYPITHTSISVTIIAPDTTTADGLSTAVMVLGKEKGLNLINSLEEVEGIIITEKTNQDERELEIILSDNLKEGKYNFETE